MASKPDTELEIHKSRGGLVVRSLRWGRRVPDSKPDPLKIRSVWGLLHVKSYVVATRPPVGVVSLSSLERGCQFRCRLRHLIAVQNYKVRPK
ncbi:hypothetical protein AVEN_27247-1 [Araneus ventricosus]|uniref:Uncharacterized protein n=1 Tax=Araneus ventricosus TaxID=182803 RepID=A0A4Y2CA03_ARAVE|nr:hypothetical protein AVEN_27247-1 [Araneus ventricosus]